MQRLSPPSTSAQIVLSLQVISQLAGPTAGVNLTGRAPQAREQLHQAQPHYAPWLVLIDEAHHAIPDSKLKVFKGP